jgi:hypothetical protein
VALEGLLDTLSQLLAVALPPLRPRGLATPLLLRLRLLWVCMLRTRLLLSLCWHLLRSGCGSL